MTVQLAGNLLTSPADRAAGAAVGEKQGLSSCAGKRPVQGRFAGFPGGGPPCGNALPNCSATYCGRGNDSLPTGEGVAFHDPTAWRYLVFHDPPAPIGPPCPSEFRTRSSRESSKIWTTVPMRQFVATAARRERGAWGTPPSSRACGYPWALLAPIPSASSLPPGPLCGWFPERDRCRPAARSYSPLPFRFLFSSKN